MATIRRGTTATGHLIWTVPQPIQQVSFKPEPPPPTMPAKATIESYQTPITLGQTSRAVAKVTQGKPDRFRWQWLNGGTWITAADNPASDLDHHYAFVNAGSYNIRLQTVVKGVVVDTSSSTSRVVQVQAQPTPIPPEPGPGPTPPVPGPGEVLIHLTDMRNESPIRDAEAWAQQAPTVVKRTDTAGYVVLAATSSGVCVKKADYHSPGLPTQDHTCVPIVPPRVPIEMVLERVPPPPPAVPDIHPGGRIFYDAANVPWRYKGVSGFQLGNRFERGEDIRPFLDAYRGYNTIRVWAYTDWAGTGWAPPANVTVVKDFLDYVAHYSGHLVEYTYLTNDSLAMSDWAIGFVKQMAESPKPRMFAEIRNEPQTHSQSVSTKRCKLAFDQSGFVYASGNYEVSENAFGPYLCAHTQRDSEWPRRAHDLMEYFNGGGPHKPSDPSHKVPCLGDEPPKPQDVAAPSAGPLGLTKADDFRAYFGTCALLGAGATYHCESGKWALPPTDEEKVLAAAALEGLDAFPANAPLANYTRPNDSSLRTYVMGNYSVRIRPTTPNHPGGSGWQRTGSSPILWHR